MIGIMAVLDSVPYVSIKNTRWLYRGEGNANLVIAIPEYKVIIRMEKCNYEVKISSEMVEEREKKLIRGVEFQIKIIVPFLGRVFIQPPFLGRLHKEEIIELDRQLYGKRPIFRLTKGIRYELVTVHPDYTYLPPVLTKDSTEKLLKNRYSDCGKWTGMQHYLDRIKFLPLVSSEDKITKCNESTYCIEIKPKQGWVFPADRHHPKCTYCLNQYLKVKKKRISRISEYCPMDLFSGNVCRMKKAIKNLLITPQNNLKIFKNGDVVYSDDTKGNYIEIIREWLGLKLHKDFSKEKLIDKWTGLVTDALLKELTEEVSFDLSIMIEGAENNHCHSGSPLKRIIDSCDWSPSTLPNNCILHRLLMIQKLQEVNFSSLYEIYSLKKYTEGDYDYVDRLLYSNEPPGAIERYLLSTTAKDCSIFIAFRHTKVKSDGSLHYIEDGSEGIYQMNVGISDIDPKPLSCIEKHFKRDKDVVDAVFKYVQQTG